MVNDFEDGAAFDMLIWEQAMLNFMQGESARLFVATLRKHMQAELANLKRAFKCSGWWERPDLLSCEWLIYREDGCDHGNLFWKYDFTTEKSDALECRLHGVRDGALDYWSEYGLATAEEMRIDVLHEVFLHVFQWYQAGLFYYLGGHPEDDGELDVLLEVNATAEHAAASLVDELLTIFRMPGNPFDKWDRSDQPETVEDVEDCEIPD